MPALRTRAGERGCLVVAEEEARAMVGDRPCHPRARPPMPMVRRANGLRKGPRNSPSEGEGLEELETRLAAKTVA
jgi:hypothetical protein